ncbi:MAG: hypothetical protein GTN65_17970, partial [Armatimonadetes bacterium]|nr:hypothetical protein [Armatimonadota bacterium]NIM24919.1 hypothetical protein [Armatimonadota bacterium]NIN07009.1 hypothetical protein [Armatimonadota bacterium]NIO98927.1 hypothetical protein [Armatimonadota bacterium]NIT32315.1 hypothetical protein [Armatimonadota bacterium]
MIGLIGGPLLAAKIGLSGLFYLLALLGFLAMVLSGLFFPSGKPPQQEEPQTGMAQILKHTDLRPIYLATFILSFILNLFFFTYPLSWTNLGLEKSQ